MPACQMLQTRRTPLSPRVRPLLWGTRITNHPFSTLKNGWYNPKVVLLFFSLTVLRKRKEGLHWPFLHLRARFIEE